jgi:hypothetical protein
MPLDFDNPTSLTLASGVRLKLRPPAPKAITLRQEQFELTKPKPPMVYIEDKGREEPNEADPDYVYALELHEAKRSEMITDILALTGTSLDHLPEGMEGPESDWFADLLLALKIDVSPARAGRYVQWLKYHAATETELNHLNRQLLVMLGTPEQEVNAALEDMKSLAERRAAQGPSSAGNGVNRPTL